MMRWIGRDKKLLVTEIAEKNYYDNKNRLFFPKIKKNQASHSFPFLISHQVKDMTSRKLTGKVQKMVPQMVRE